MKWKGNITRVYIWTRLVLVLKEPLEASRINMRMWQFWGYKLLQGCWQRRASIFTNDAAWKYWCLLRADPVLLRQWGHSNLERLCLSSSTDAHHGRNSTNVAVVRFRNDVVLTPSPFSPSFAWGEAVVGLDLWLMPYGSSRVGWALPFPCCFLPGYLRLSLERMPVAARPWAAGGQRRRSISRRNNTRWN